MTDTLVTLTNHHLEAQLHPALGARIGRLRRHAHTSFDYLRPIDPNHFDLSRWQRAGCFAMLPFTNKLPGNTLIGSERAIQVAAPGAGALLHGWGLRNAWRVVEKTSAHCTMMYAANASNEWPWAYRATFAFSLGPASLHVALSIVNESGQPMPVGLGLHPYFSLGSRTAVTVESHARWQADSSSDGLPVIREPLDQTLRLNLQGKSGPEETLTWFCEIDETDRAIAVIDYPDEGRRVTLHSTHATHLVVHARAGEPFVCLEPCSHLAGKLVAPVDCAYPGEPFVLQMRLELE